MSKNKDLKRKAQLEQKAKNESFRFQVLFGKKNRMPELADDDARLVTEMDTLCAAGLGTSMLTLAEIVVGAERELGISQEAEKNSLNGTLVPFLLGITSAKLENDNTLFAGAESLELPLQVSITYDNEVRNQVVDWVKSRYEGMTTRLGQPILKLKNMVVEFKREVKR